MNGRGLVVVAVVASLLGVGAVAFLGGGDAGVANDGATPPVEGTVQAATPLYRAPDIARPLPKRPAPAKGPKARREGIRTELPDHDYSQQYPATLEALEDAVVARAHRLFACTDVHGMPAFPPNFPVDDDFDPNQSMAFELLLSEGEDGGKVDLHLNGATEELIHCFYQAIGDLSIDSPGAEGMSSQLVIPMAG